MLNEITQYNNNILEDKSKKKLPSYIGWRLVWRNVSTFQGVAEAEQQNVGPQKKFPPGGK